MGKKSTPKPPDYTELTQASLEMGRENAQVAREQLAWGREQDTANRALLERVLGVQLPIMEEQFANAREDRQRYEEVFQPIEDKLIDEFQNYGSPERFDKERGRAVADVSANFDAQRKNALARLESYGIDPSQTRNQALDMGMRTAQAAAQAGAADAATQRVENTGRALRAEAINIGRGMPSQVAQSYGQAIGAGQAGIGGAAQSTGSSIGAMQSGIPFSGVAQNGYNSAGNWMSQGFNDRMAIRSQNLDIFGTIAGGALGAMQEGGVVPEQGALPISPVPGGTDRKLLLATPGEVVVPKDVVEWKGQEFFHKLNTKVRDEVMAIEIEKRTPPGQQMQQAIPVGA
jgi:hypothetical protein